ncbi:MAG: YeeE/YedE family protein [Dehalococcoidia bacterium]|nr:MAG: YeeE/YedE family protein [Dehalococcoidia bacterium]
MDALVWTGVPVGLAFGFALSRGRFCMNSAFRDPIVLKDFTLLKAVAVAVIVSMMGFGIMEAADVIDINPKPLFWGASMAGGFVFGVGMVLAGGCASGITYRSGEGMVGAMVAVLGLGIFATATVMGPLKYVADYLQTNTKVEYEGASPTLAFDAPYSAVAIPIAAAAILAWVAFTLLRRDKGQQAQEESIPLVEQIFRRGWGWLPTGIVIGLIGMVAFWASSEAGRNYPLAVTGGYVTGLKTLLLGHNFFDWGTMLILSAIVGAGIAALLAKEFQLRAPSPGTLIQCFVGGGLMGFGCMVSKGCNITHILSGWPQLSAGSLLAGVFIILGCWAASWWMFVRPMRAAGM